MQISDAAIHGLFRGVDLVGVLANALLGGATARRERLDPVGFATLAILSGGAYVCLVARWRGWRLPHATARNDDRAARYFRGAGATRAHARKEDESSSKEKP